MKDGEIHGIHFVVDRRPDVRLSTGFSSSSSTLSSNCTGFIPPLVATNDSLIDYCGGVAEKNDLHSHTLCLYLLDAERKNGRGGGWSATAKCEDDDDLSSFASSISRFRRPFLRP